MGVCEGRRKRTIKDGRKKERRKEGRGKHAGGKKTDGRRGRERGRERGERETNKISFDLDEGTGVVGRPLEMRIGPVAQEGWCGDERPRVGTL